MLHWENMWSFKTAHYRITWDITPDDDCDLSWDNTGEARENLASGLWQCFGSRVAVWHRGKIIGEDTLWGSIYEKPAEFRDHIGSRGKYRSYFSDMARNAIMLARDYENAEKRGDD